MFDNDCHICFRGETLALELLKTNSWVVCALSFINPNLYIQIRLSCERRKILLVNKILERLPKKKKSNFRAVQACKNHSQNFEIQHDWLRFFIYNI